MPELLIIGNGQCFHVGAHFLNAARTLDIPAEFLDLRQASEGRVWRRRFNWWLRGRRPVRLESFSEHVLDCCRRLRPRLLLATGLAPLTRICLDQIGRLGVVRCNFLTDDPWNPANRAPWFLDALPSYDRIFSPRTANIEDLRRAGCPNVAHLPFAYAPEIHFPEEPAPAERSRFEADVILAGGADKDRLPWARALIRSGLKVALYGGYWDRHYDTRPSARGHADPATLRKATATARINLCLVRRANRDGHVMRTFEIPALGGCMLTEDTQEHRDLFGPDGEATVYFTTPHEAVTKAKCLLNNDTERLRLATAAHKRIVSDGNTYADRLVTILRSAGSRPALLSVSPNALLDVPARR